MIQTYDIKMTLKSGRTPVNPVDQETYWSEHYVDSICWEETRSCREISEWSEEEVTEICADEASLADVPPLMPAENMEAYFFLAGAMAKRVTI